MATAATTETRADPRGYRRDDQRLDTRVVPPEASILEAFRALEMGEQGVVFVCNEGRRVLGTITDGDLRRALLRGCTLEDRVLPELMTRDFISVTAEAPRDLVLDMMLAHQVHQIPVLDREGRLEALHTIRSVIGSEMRPNAAVIMAGGRGTRLRPYTDELPKPMVPVAGRPILERLVLHLVSHGIRKLYLSVNYLAPRIERHFGDGAQFGCEIEYLRERRPMGTAGALSLLEDALEHPILVVNGDLLTQANVGAFLDFHEEGGFAASMGIRPYAVKIPFGVATTSGDRLVGLSEKPSVEHRVNAGIYVLAPGILSYVPEDEEYQMPDLFQACLTGGLRVGAFLIEGNWMDVGYPGDLMRANGFV